MKQVVGSIFIIIWLVFLTIPVFAAGTEPFINLGDRQKAGAIPGITAVGNPNAGPGNILSNVIRIMYAVGGMSVLLFVVWGAMDWITAGGDKEKIAGARRKIVNAFIGLTLLALSAFIVSLFGQIVGIDPTKMGILPSLGQQAR